MNEFAEFEAAKPDDVELDAATDARIRRALGLTDAAIGDDRVHPDIEHRHGDDGTSVGSFDLTGARRDESRRRWAAIAASAAAVVLGVVGFAVVGGDRDTRPASEEPASSPTLLSPADPEATSLDPPPTDVDVSNTPQPDGSVTSQFETTDPLVEGLRIEVARAAERIGWSFTATEGTPGTPESPGATMIGANGGARYIFEFRPVDSDTDCPVGDWASELVDSSDPGTTLPQGVLFVDEANGNTTTAQVVTRAGVISVGSINGPAAEPFDDAFASIALYLADRIGYITHGGQRPEFVEVYCGDLLDDVARRYDTTNAALVELNDLTDANAIFAGMVLELPPADAPTEPRPVPDGVGRGSDMTLLVADPAPAGFVLDRARYMPDVGGFGIARYVHPDHDTQLHVVIRSIPLPVERLQALGWEPFDVNDRDVWPDGETEGCLPDACSVGLQWDDDTYVSLMWVDPDGGNLVGGATTTTLLDLVANLTEAADQWTELPPSPDSSLPQADPGRPGAVVVANANTVGGSAGALSARLDRLGFDVADPINAATDASNPPLQDTIVYAAPGSECEAEQVAEVLGVKSVDALPNPPPTANGTVRDDLRVLVLLGDDIATQLDERFVPQASTIDC